MHAILRRYEGVDSRRSVELARNVDEKFIPKLNELPGFSGYYLIEAGNGVMTSVSVFETAEQADKSSRIASTWVRDEKLEKVLPNPPKITFGEVVRVKSSARLTVWSPSKDSTFEVRGEGPLAGLLPFSSRHIPETPPMQLPSLVLAHGKLVSGPQLGPVR